MNRSASAPAAATLVARLLRRLLLLVGLVLAGAALWWWRQPEPVAVRVVAVGPGVVEQLVVNTRAGTVDACQRSRLSLPIGGLVEEIYVKEGDHVTDGQLLVALWSRGLQARLASSQALAAKAGLDVERICISARKDEREAKRMQGLRIKSLVSEELLDRAETQAETSAVACSAADISLQQARAMVQLQQALLDQTRLKAPFAGVVAEVSAELGEFSTPSPTGVQTPPLVDLLTDDCYYVTAPIDEVDAAQVRVGQPVRVTLDAWRGHVIEGEVRRIGNYVQDFERQARTVEIEVELAALGEVLPLAGYSADVEIIVRQQHDSLRIPTEALLGEQTVLVLPEDDAPLERRTVMTGLSNWHFTEVTGGLVAGDLVVLSLGEPGVVAGARARAAVTETVPAVPVSVSPGSAKPDSAETRNEPGTKTGSHTRRGTAADQQAATP